MPALRHLVACALAAASARPLAAQAAAPPAAAIVGVTIIDPAVDSVRRQATILLRDGRIAAIGGRDLDVPPGTRVIAAHGQYVIPGLWDMHTHLAQPLGGFSSLQENAEYFFPLFLAYGVTGVRDMGGDLATLRRWRWAIERGEQTGPRLIITGEKVGKGPVVQGAPFPLRDAGDVQRTVQALYDSGAMFVKLDVISPALFGTLVRDAWHLNLRVAGHVEALYSVRDLARLGLRSVEHLDGVLLASHPREDSLRRLLVRQQHGGVWHRLLMRLGLRESLAEPEVLLSRGHDAARADSLYDLFRRTGTWHCPTLRLLGTLYRDTAATMRLAPDSLQVRLPADRWNGFAAEPWPAEHPWSGVQARYREMVARMAVRGVGLLAGSDTPGLYAVPGHSLHQELGILVAAGLTPRAALRAATTGAADFLEARDSLGTIRPGAVADLVLLDADPLADIANTQRIRAVFARGRYFDRAALDGFLAQGARAAQRARGGM